MPGANAALGKGQRLLATPGALCTVAPTQRTPFPSLTSLKFCCIPAWDSAWSFSPPSRDRGVALGRSCGHEGEPSAFPEEGEGEP